MSYVSASARQRVIDRAKERCEYCLFPQCASLFTFEMEHIISEKHGGVTEVENLALACPYCNRAKGSDLGSIDPDTRQLTPFFNPRTQRWEDHFRLETAMIVPLTGATSIRYIEQNKPPFAP
ncbi:HNH endonuclease [Phormidesmis sp. 146-33]